METTVTALEVFEQGLTKSAIKSMAQNAIESVKEQGNVLKVAEALSAMETFIKEVKADESFKEYTREEIGKYPKGFVSNSGAKLELAETGSKYDFSQCNDLMLERLEEAFFTAEKNLKERKEFLKTVPSEGLALLDMETGETVMCYPPSKTSISSYKVTLSK